MMGIYEIVFGHIVQSMLVILFSAHIILRDDRGDL